MQGKGDRFYALKAITGKTTSPTFKSKNWSMVRAYTGWRRYDTDEELKVLDSLLRLVAMRHNLFMPQMKLATRKREGGKVFKTYDMDTPLKRALEGSTVDEATKEKLLTTRNSTDIVWLSREIVRASERLSHAYENKIRRLNNDDYV